MVAWSVVVGCQLSVVGCQMPVRVFGRVLVVRRFQSRRPGSFVLSFFASDRLVGHCRLSVVSRQLSDVHSRYLGSFV